MPAPTRVRAVAVGCSHLIANQVFLGQSLPDHQARLRPNNCDLLVAICIHMAGCSYATRLRVAVVTGAAGPLLGRFGLWRPRSASIPMALCYVAVVMSQLPLGGLKQKTGQQKRLGRETDNEVR